MVLSWETVAEWYPMLLLLLKPKAQVVAQASPWVRLLLLEVVVALLLELKVVERLRPIRIRSTPWWQQHTWEGGQWVSTQRWSSYKPQVESQSQSQSHLRRVW